MRLDTLGEFADNISVAAAAGTSLVDEVIDLQGVTNYPGDGIPNVWLIIEVTTQIITGGTAGLIQFALMSGPEAAITTTPTTHILSPELLTDDAIALDAAIAAGTAHASNQIVAADANRPAVLAVVLPAGPYQRYMGVKKIITTTTTTAGAVNAFLTRNPEQWTAHASAPYATA